MRHQKKLVPTSSRAGSKRAPARKAASRPKAVKRRLPRSDTPKLSIPTDVRPHFDITRICSCHTSMPPTEGTTVSVCAVLPIEEVKFASSDRPKPQPESTTVFTYDQNGRLLSLSHERTEAQVESTSIFTYTDRGLPAGAKPKPKAAISPRCTRGRPAKKTVARKAKSPRSAVSKTPRKPATLKIESSRRPPTTKLRRAA
jgi:hypothetical protein